MEKTEYYQIHTQNLITTKYKIDVSLFEEQIQIFPFQKWGDMYPELERFATPLVNRTGIQADPEDESIGPLDRTNFLKVYPHHKYQIWTDEHLRDWKSYFSPQGFKLDDMLLENHFQMKCPALSITSLDPIDELKPYMYRSSILKWNYGAHFLRHYDNWFPAQWIRLWGTTRPDRMVLRYEEGHTGQMVEEMAIEPGRLYLHDSVKPHEALAYRDGVYQFFIALNPECLKIGIF